jgi:hypothetical protein
MNAAPRSIVLVLCVVSFTSITACADAVEATAPPRRDATPPPARLGATSPTAAADVREVQGSEAASAALRFARASGVQR